MTSQEIADAARFMLALAVICFIYCLAYYGLRQLRRKSQLAKFNKARAAAPKLYTLQCVDGPMRGYQEQRELVPGAEVFLILESEQGKFAYEPAGMLPGGNVAMQFVHELSE